MRLKIADSIKISTRESWFPESIHSHYIQHIQCSAWCDASRDMTDAFVPIQKLLFQANLIYAAKSISLGFHSCCCRKICPVVTRNRSSISAKSCTGNKMQPYFTVAFTRRGGEGKQSLWDYGDITLTRFYLTKYNAYKRTRKGVESGGGLCKSLLQRDSSRWYENAVIIYSGKYHTKAVHCPKC